ncbi:sugar transferase [Sulfurovum sp. bin170]|uniref:sugar transferase n=1 Tax=Sulfurovum sp. bin170 TaxID=2695268 RepID=UPI0013E0DA24|nr:sugar transferase [Sulfurovum sp. bin170]NEW61587.1 sugar transferase [Sulfurovum sp. bin170]
MIILGDRYSFSRVEKDRLKKRFNTINQISYKTLPAEECTIQIKKILKSANSKLIVLNTKAALPPKLLTYLTKLEIRGIRYMTVEHFMEKYLHKCLILDESFDVSFLDDIHSYTTFQKIQKRVVDFIAIIMLLIPTLLAVIYSAYRIKKESPGTLFFRQKRVGLGECEFSCIKLRSMNIDAEKDGAKFATDNDPRAFPWGEKIRYTKIDELIQLWNVFKGEMHFVGPRPERKIWTNEFEKSIPYYTQRHIVAPGITGLAQIKYQYGSGKLDAKEKLMYDLYYIKNWNIFLELEVIWKTILFVLTKKRENLSNF